MIGWFKKLVETPAPPRLEGPLATVLVVDTSITIAKVFELTLSEAAGFRVRTLADGREALSEVESAAPDLVFADQQLPGLDGFELCREIKRRSSAAPVPVVIMTGTFEKMDRAKAGEVGADAVLFKPFDSNAVLRQAMELVRAYRARVKN